MEMERGYFHVSEDTVYGLRLCGMCEPLIVKIEFRKTLQPHVAALFGQNTLYNETTSFNVT
jgi:hypothetical protein